MEVNLPMLAGNLPATLFCNWILQKNGGSIPVHVYWLPGGNLDMFTLEVLDRLLYRIVQMSKKMEAVNRPWGRFTRRLPSICREDYPSIFWHPE